MKRLRTLKSFQIFKTETKNLKPIAVDDFFKAYRMYHSHADLICLDGTLKKIYLFFLLARVLIGFSAEVARLAVW